MKELLEQKPLRTKLRGVKHRRHKTKTVLLTVLRSDVVGMRRAPVAQGSAKMQGFNNIMTREGAKLHIGWSHMEPNTTVRVGEIYSAIRLVTKRLSKDIHQNY